MSVFHIEMTKEKKEQRSISIISSHENYHSDEKISNIDTWKDSLIK